jgi:hypothetical protein
MPNENVPAYPLLEQILKLKGLALQPMYTNADVALLFGVSTRTILNWAANGALQNRRLIGRARFLPTDLETFLSGSKNSGGL